MMTLPSQTKEYRDNVNKEFSDYRAIHNKRKAASDPLTVEGWKRNSDERNKDKKLARNKDYAQRKKEEEIASHISKRTNLLLTKTLKVFRDWMRDTAEDEKYYLQIRSRLEVCIRLSEEWESKHNEKAYMKDMNKIQLNDPSLAKIHRTVDKIIGGK